MLSFPSFDQLSCVKPFHKFASNSFFPRGKKNTITISLALTQTFASLASHCKYIIRTAFPSVTSRAVKQALILESCSLWLHAPCTWDCSFVSPAEGTVSASVTGCFSGQITETIVRSCVDTTEQAFRHDSTDLWMHFAAPWSLGYLGDTLGPQVQSEVLLCPESQTSNRRNPSPKELTFCFHCLLKGTDELWPGNPESVLQKHVQLLLFCRRRGSCRCCAEAREPERSWLIRRIAYHFSPKWQINKGSSKLSPVGHIESTSL